jgi:hypothetical protein
VKTLSDVQAATDAELLAFWNMHNEGGRLYDKMISDRSKFEGWCVDLIEELELEAADSVFEAVAKDHHTNETEVGTRALQSMLNQMGGTASSAGIVPLAKTAVTSTPRPKPLSETQQARSSNAAGVSASWSDTSVKSARLTRDGVNVTVNGSTTTHKSTREAFREYRLPDSKHIRFRLKLKASKDELFEHEGLTYHFTIG